MRRKIRVAILFGGRSAEHEVSLLSAKNVLAAIDRNKHAVTEILIPRNGDFDINTLKKFDVVFPVLHGPYGEDGTIQGLLKMVNVPFVGAGVLGSAVGMDKDVQKRLLRDAGIPIAKFVVLEKVAEVKVKLPVFVKPANLGSSVGITKAHNQRELKKAIKKAFEYDSKIIVEEAIVGREIECSVLGNEEPIVSLPGEIIPKGRHEFYDYDAKYLDENGATLAVPAKITKRQVSKIQKTAIKAYKVLCCEGMARVDMFLAKNGTVFINEINTIPGFTNISMYPKLWEVSGIPYPKLIDRLIQLALERHAKELKLRISR